MLKFCILASMATTYNNWEFKVQPENNQVVKYKKIIHEYLTKEEIKQLHEKSNWAARLSCMTRRIIPYSKPES